MTSIYPLTDREPKPAGPEASGPEAGKKERVIDSIIGDLPPVASAQPVESSEFVFGPRQLASLAFVGILIVGLMSAIAYFAGRTNTTPRVTERVIERVVQAPQPAPQTAPLVVDRTTPKPVETASTAAQAAPIPQPMTMNLVASRGKAEVTAPALNRTYLQLGSVEIGVAEVMVEGLRQRGVPAIVGIGISSRVARVLVGPFTSPEELQVAQKHVEELGFHPFPRVFTEKDLEQQPAALAPATATPALLIGQRPAQQTPVPTAPPAATAAPPHEKP